MRQMASLMAILAALLMAMPAVSMAETVSADFTGGVSTDVPDGYTGCPGGGWENAWVERPLSNGSLSNTIIDTIPLKTGMGNYLSYYQNQTSGTSAVSACVSRDYVDETTPLIDVTKDYTIQFSVRIDEDIDGTGTTFTTSNDRYLFHGSKVVSSSTNTQAQTTATFDVRLYADRANDDLEGYWLAYDGTTLYQMGTKKVTDGVVYDFTIDIDAETNTYLLTIDGNGETATRTVACRGTVEEREGAVTFTGVSHTTADHRAMSIDGIKISQVPEPSMLMMGLALFGWVLARRSK